MLSRNDIRLAQVKMLLEAGIVPVSIDYRLCPEVSLIEGPMTDALDAFRWIRETLPTIVRRRQDVLLDGSRVVTIGWSTGGMLALSLGWTSSAKGLQPPEATLAFYCPTDYEDDHWLQPNVPAGSESAAAEHANYELGTTTLAAGVFNHPITSYNVPQAIGALGGWMAPNDARSRIALYMNWKGKTLEVLLNGLSTDGAIGKGRDALDAEMIAAISPLAQIRGGRYAVPTFIIHPRQDDLIPWEQGQRTFDALQEAGVESHLRVLEGEAHLFDLRLEAGHKLKSKSAKAVADGYRFLTNHTR